MPILRQILKACLKFYMCKTKFYYQETFDTYTFLVFFELPRKVFSLLNSSKLNKFDIFKFIFLRRVLLRVFGICKLKVHILIVYKIRAVVNGFLLFSQFQFFTFIQLLSKKVL